mgnify:FL=1
MKTAISVPDSIFAGVEQMAQRQKTSRSAIFSAAAQEYVQRHRGDDVTRQLNEVYAKEDSALDPLLERMQMISLPKEAW